MMVTLTVLLSSLRRPSEGLLVLILPVGALAIMIAWLTPVESYYLAAGFSDGGTCAGVDIGLWHVNGGGISVSSAFLSGATTAPPQKKQ